METRNFFNDFVEHPQALTIALVFGFGFLVAFALLFNRWMDDLGEKKRGYTAMLVALGNLVTLAVVALVSWKASLLVFLAFLASGIPMIWGDVRRSDRTKPALANPEPSAKKAPRRKALPYAAAGLVSEALMSLTDAQRNIRTVLQTNEANRLGLTAMDVDTAILKLTEALKEQGE